MGPHALDAIMHDMKSQAEHNPVAPPRSSSYRDLTAWRKAMELVVSVYAETGQLSTDERFGLTQQMRRSAVSIPSNIAEGWGRGPTPDFTRFLRMARGSIFELSTQAEICASLKFPGEWSAILDQADELRRILQGLIRSREGKSNRL